FAVVSGFSPHAMSKCQSGTAFDRAIRPRHGRACAVLQGSRQSRMAYFRNNTVNLLNLHYGLHSFALSGSSAFFGVFLLKSGVPAPIVLLSIAAILLGRLLIRPSVLICAKR